ncbi:hypothetical protein PHYPSEUDO_006016 [Phytophthora pseudosyringae]|uniref:Uncharacterized protein n=1 Tax=Phytophthora pseudosyringae TaxID=221518 RepID=A0A8T1VML2_9STRA|nr:hypothetical protein PHYPSEUDO_006016 [Phytophthora pseudosyringae]
MPLAAETAEYYYAKRKKVAHEIYGFLSPWCVFVEDKIDYKWPKREEDYWAEPRRRLEVYLPTRGDTNWGEPIYPNDQAFLTHLRKIREALALLAAVAHFDPTAWKCILELYCDVEFGEVGEELFEELVPAEFVLFILQDNDKYPATLQEEIVQFCGTDQREHPSALYLEALNRIATLDGERLSDGRGVNIEIPVRVIFLNDFATPRDGPIEELLAIQRAERAVREEWDSYNRRLNRDEVECGPLRCTFVLEPLLADFGDNRITSRTADTVQRVVAENMWCSQLYLWVSIDREPMTNARATTIVLGQIMASLFDRTRRSPELANTNYHYKLTDSRHILRPLQLGSINFECEAALRPCDFAPMHSAMVVNQTTKQLSMRLYMVPDDSTGSTGWWEWIAYAFFSKRARSCSALESLALISIGRLTPADVEAFSAVMTSDHPEETLFHCPRGTVDERDATLKAEAPIRWQFDGEGQPVMSSSELRFPTATNSVRTFSDDGTSKWVNVLIPGYGRCHVRRTDLMFDTESISDGSGGVTTLKIGFHKYDPSISSGVPQFLEVVGVSLKSLTLDGPMDKMNTNAIIRSCPNLEELSLCGFCIGAQLDFSKFHANNEPLPFLSCNWADVGSLSKALSATNSALCKCVRRLRIRLKNRQATWGHGPGDYNAYNFEGDIKALLHMLETNSTLEFLEVVAPDDRQEHRNAFIEQHRFKDVHWELRPLLKESKLAFLSVTSPMESTKKVKRGWSQPRFNLNRDVLETIFAFGAVPVRRKVFYRQENDEDWETEMVQVVI